MKYLVKFHYVKSFNLNSQLEYLLAKIFYLNHKNSILFYCLRVILVKLLL